MTTDADTTDADRLVVVRVLGLPVPIHQQASQHADGLTREFTLLAEQISDGDTDGVPARLIQLTTVLSHQYSGFTEEAEERIEAAIEAGEHSIDELIFHVPVHAGEAAAALGGLLDEADDYCRAGQHLLTLAAPPELLVYRRWYLDEFIRQTQGKPPTPWPDYRSQQ